MRWSNVCAQVVLKIVLLCNFLCLSQCDNGSLVLISKVRAPQLSKYRAYADAIIIHLEIPQDITFASIKIVAEEAKIMGCSIRPVELYTKHSSMPVISPDGSKFPPEFKHIARSNASRMDIKSDGKSHYLNMSLPEPGCYYITAFLPYEDPRKVPIQPAEMRPNCMTSIDALLYIQSSKIEQILDDTYYTVGTSRVYKFHVDQYTTNVLVSLENIGIEHGEVIVSIQGDTLPGAEDVFTKLKIGNRSRREIIKFVPVSSWYYINIDMKSAKNASMNLIVMYYYYEPSFTNSTHVSPPYTELYTSSRLTGIIPYKQYDLVRESGTESFSFAYKLPHRYTLTPARAVNISDSEYSILKFPIRRHADVGATLTFGLAYDPKLTSGQRKYTVIACLRPYVAELPTWKDKMCTDHRFGGEKAVSAPIVINSTVSNATVQVPYPEYGFWYASFRLFCDECRECTDCPATCQRHYQRCTNECTSANCTARCRQEVLEVAECGARCDCYGDCRRPTNHSDSCNNSVIFYVGADACPNDCGKNGRCTFMEADGVVYTACVCFNKYRGWDCSDDTLATPYWEVVLELLLLVLSNLAFIATIYFAYRRGYYIEALVFTAICFFSTFYHACDAGENLINFCMTRLNALQFADFYCAQLAIWVTLIAIADLPYFWPGFAHMCGAIVMAVTTTVNKTAVWVYLIPAIAGLILVVVSWYLKWRKVRQRFLNKKYAYIFLPAGLVLVVVGVTIFTFLQTEENYKYLHSSWHVVMAIAGILLLPSRDTFQPETTL